MLKKHVFTALALSAALFNTHLNAILPPLYQTAQELKMILENDRIGKVLPSGEPIVDIHKNENGYEIITPHYHLQANVIYKPAERPGPAQFDIDFQKADKINQ